MKWREVGPGEFWLMFEDAPDPVRNESGCLAAGRKDGSVWPPSMVANWSGTGSCLHLWSYSNGAEPAEPGEDDEDYLHVCNLSTFMDELQDLMDTSGWSPAEWETVDA